MAMNTANPVPQRIEFEFTMEQHFQFSDGTHVKIGPGRYVFRPNKLLESGIWYIESPYSEKLLTFGGSTGVYNLSSGFAPEFYEMLCRVLQISPPSPQVQAENGLSGMYCEGCKDFCSWVEPNQPNGKYACPACRSGGALSRIA